jgi:hypothetical protein
MADFFFFTAFDSISDAGGITNPQISSDSYGPQSNSVFRINSLHKSKDTTDPYAFAVTEGRVLVHNIPGDSSHVTLILQPFDNISEVGSLESPKVKYYIYRNILWDSVFVAGSSPTLLPLGGSDMIDRIRGSKHSSVGEPAITDFTSTGSPSDFLDTNFHNLKNLKKIFAGDTIGKFDHTGFSFEVVLDTDDFNPTLDFVSKTYDAGSLFNVTLGGSNAADNFKERQKKEYILNFIDPSAFYGNFFYKGIKAKKNDKTDVPADSAILMSDNKRNVLLQVLKKFYNNSKAYIDIRNENNYSFNYYGFVNDPLKKDYYSIYTDTIDADFINYGGTLNSPGLNYYGTDNWPLMIINNSQFNTSNTKEKNIVSLKLPKGNNNGPLIYMSNGIKNSGKPEDHLKFKKIKDAERFTQLKSLSSTTNYEAFEIIIPNDVTNSNTKLVCNYTRLKYIRKITPIDFFVTPSVNDVQFIDNIFVPLKLKDQIPTGSIVKRSSYENERFVDLHGADQLRESCYIAATGIAEDNNNITLYAFPLSEKEEVGTSKTPISEVTSENDKIDDFINLFNKKTDVKSKEIVTDELILTPNTYRIVYFPTTTKIQRILGKNDYSKVIMLIIDKANYNNLVIGNINTLIANNTFSGEFDITLVIKDQSHRDQDNSNDDDDSTPNPKSFMSCSLYLKGFKLNGSNIDVVEFDTGIRLYTKLEDNLQIHNVLKDKDAILNTGDGDFLPFTCGIFTNTARPNVSSSAVISDFNKYSTYSTVPIKDFTSNLYYQDLIDFITILYSHINTDATSKKLYINVFQKFVTQTTTYDTVNKLYEPALPITLNIVGGKISSGSAYMHQGLLAEGANYFSVWKLMENLKATRNLIRQIDLFPASITTFPTLPGEKDLSVGRQKNKFNFLFDHLLQNNVFFNNLCQALQKGGMPLPKYILENATKSYYLVADMISIEHLFDHTLTGGQNGILGAISTFYGRYNDIVENNKKKLNANTLKKIINSFNEEKQKYITQLTKCVYGQLGGILTEYEILNVAIGDATPTTGLFGTAGPGGDDKVHGGDGILLFNYSYTGDDSSKTGGGDFTNLTTDKTNKINDLRISERNDEAYQVHFGIYGIDLPQSVDPVTGYPLGPDPFEDTVIINTDGSPVPGGKFVLKYEPIQTFKVQGLPVPNVGFWVDTTKDLIIEKPASNRYNSLSLNLHTAADEQTFCIVLYKSNPPKVINFAKSFEDLFANDRFELTTNKFNHLWDPINSESEVLANLIEILKSSSDFQINTLTSGGIGRLIIPASSLDYKATSNYSTYGYVAGDTLSFDDEIFKCLNTTSIDPNSLSPGPNWRKLEIPYSGTFAEGDFIKYNNTIYRANQTVSTSATFVSSEWDIAATGMEYFSETTDYLKDKLVMYNEHLYKALNNLAKGTFNYSQWILQPDVETDPGYVFNPPVSGLATDPWTRLKGEDTTNSGGGTLESIQYSRLRYSYASIEFDPLSYELNINVSSYASPLYSNLDVPDTVNFDGESNLPTGVTSNQWQCLPLSTILKQNSDSDAYIPNASPANKDSFNKLLSALRVMGLLHGILKKIKDEAAATLDASTSASIAAKIDAFKLEPGTAVRLIDLFNDVPAAGIVQKMLTMDTFEDIITNNCP